MGVRRKSRELALQILFAMDEGDKNCRTSMKDYFKILNAPKNATEFCSTLVSGVLAHKDEIDARIAAISSNWRLDRMSGVDLNLLRIAIFELLYCDDIPPRVSINEAVDIGKKFGTEKSGAFINGILDSIYHGMPDKACETEPGGAEGHLPS